MPLRSFLVELRRRNVYRAAVFYAAAGWLLVQIATQVFPFFNIANWVVRLVVVAVLVGFPIAMAFAWYYEWTPEGFKRESVIAAEASQSRTSGKALDRWIVAVLALAVAVLLADKFVLHRDSTVSNQSIAVLPFVDMSQDRDQEFFSDGLSEELLDVLANVPQLQVVGRTSSFAFKGKRDDLRLIGQTLNVATVLEGSVRKSGDRIRITAQLINVADGFHLWSQTYDRQVTDIFAVQDEITNAVVAALKLKLLPEQQPNTAIHRTPNPEAYEQYLRGRQFLDRESEDGFRLASEAFAQAVKLDAKFAAGWAGYALAVTSDANLRGESVAAVLEGQQRGREYAEKALELDPTLTEGYSARAVTRYFSFDWAGAQADYDRALSLAPGDIATITQYSQLLASTGRLDDAISSVRTALDRDPLSPPAWQQLCAYLTEANQLVAARRACDRAIEIEPQETYALINLGILSLVEHTPERALADVRRIKEEDFRSWGVALAEHSLGHAEASEQALQILIAKYPQTYAYAIATVYAWRGEREPALEWLERAYQQRDGALVFMKLDSWTWRGLHDDPRYQSILRKIHLPVHS